MNSMWGDDRNAIYIPGRTKSIIFQPIVYLYNLNFVIIFHTSIFPVKISVCIYHFNCENGFINNIKTTQCEGDLSMKIRQLGFALSEKKLTH